MDFIFLYLKISLIFIFGIISFASFLIGIFIIVDISGDKFSSSVEKLIGVIWGIILLNPLFLWITYAIYSTR